MEKIIQSKTSLLFIFRNKNTGEYLTEDDYTTEDITYAVGFDSRESCERYIKELDEPDDWYIVTKITTQSVVGEPIQVTEFI